MPFQLDYLPIAEDKEGNCLKAALILHSISNCQPATSPGQKIILHSGNGGVNEVSLCVCRGLKLHRTAYRLVDSSRSRYLAGNPSY